MQIMNATLMNFLCAWLYLKYQSECDGFVRKKIGEDIYPRTVLQRRKWGGETKSQEIHVRMSTPNAPKSVAGYFVGRGNRERRKSLAFFETESANGNACIRPKGLLFLLAGQKHMM
jgi:hypothetical protein